ncbi:dihydrofolate reductase [Curvibacter sp. HBC61]|uniref:Dihydrofolate reductase n=1 Tax=Curvibacter cyanobacteriorum TaxID=3026422 RepID=A0ABT5MX92_9BURK|nr:dihydrofolate reductase [Curvibacter sp. HBC61]MDD0837954.1 dihydrofolate reductase [Curvibacter sp. HBC61]
MPLKLIFARAANGVIGRDNTLPWHLPEDLTHFKRTTLGCPVIMGRRTWDSLPPRFRPLPGRQNIVLSRNPAWVAEGALRVGSLSEALAALPAEQDVWVIGGAELYAQALPLAQQAVVTEIEQAFEGDALAPHFGPGWTESSRSDLQTSSTGLTFRFVTYTQEKGA